MILSHVPKTIIGMALAVTRMVTVTVDDHYYRLGLGRAGACRGVKKMSLRLSLNSERTMTSRFSSSFFAASAKTKEYWY